MQKAVKKQAIPYSITAIFIAAEIILGVLVQTADTSVAEISYSAIVLAFVFSLVNLNKSREWLLTALALLCTLFADYFLVLLGGEEKLIAMCFFSVTQICYFLRIYLAHKEKKIRIVHLILRAVLIAVSVAVTFTVLKDKTDALSIISIVYYANLILNVIFAFAQFKISPLFATGLLLFAFCDAFVGLSVLEDLYIDIGVSSLIRRINPLELNLAWIFYVPSQTLIALSLIKGAPSERK
ncbi:MAG: hypothetical protein E7626_04780 [Ruminococcaceae bacterium]|nr:hypothetical protein [Oscillospiraceae bacterium]